MNRQTVDAKDQNGGTIHAFVDAMAATDGPAFHYRTADATFGEN